MGWGVWVFLWGCGCTELRLGFFYGGRGGSLVWVLQVGLTMGLFGEFRVET